MTSPVAFMSLPVPRPYREVSLLADADHRGGSIPGSTDFSTPPQAARAKSVRLALALITLPRWLASSRDILGPLLLVRRTKSKPFTPMFSCQCSFATPERAGALARPVQATQVNVGHACEIPDAIGSDRTLLPASNIETWAVARGGPVNGDHAAEPSTSAPSPARRRTRGPPAGRGGPADRMGPAVVRQGALSRPVPARSDPSASPARARPSKPGPMPFWPICARCVRPSWTAASSSVSRSFPTNTSRRWPASACSA